MNETIKNKLMNKGWKIEQENDKLTVYRLDSYGYKNPYESYICDDTGVYCLYKEDFIKMYSFGSIEENLLGVYCLTEQINGQIRNQMYDDMSSISESKSIGEIQKIYLKYIDEQYISNNLNMDINVTKNNAFNLNHNGEWYELNYVVGEKQVTLVGAENINYIYADALLYLTLKKLFEQNILVNMSDVNLSEQNILDFYNAYSRGSQLKIQNLQEKKTRK